MRLKTVVGENEPYIKKNSFYDVFEDYTNAELEEYKIMAGIPTASNFEELYDNLEDG